MINGVIAWGGARPTAPAIFHERWNSPATVGAGIIWTFPDGIIVAASGSLSLHNITAANPNDVNAIIME